MTKINKITFISDTHSKHNKLKNLGNLSTGDILIHCGDISSVGYEHEIKNFFDWFLKQPFKYKIFIAGNHDFLFEREHFYAKNLIPDNENIFYLEDSGIEINNIKIWGSPVTPPFMNWAFMRDQNRIKKHWEAIPKDVDILITHGPPYGILDYSNYGHEHTGCKTLKEKVFEIKPIVHAYGHIHEGYGIEKHNNITFINASNINQHYEMVNKPIVMNIDLENKKATVVS